MTWAAYNFLYSLISKLDEVSLFAQPTFKYILPLMDNYIPDVRQSEDHSLEEQMEEDMFLDAVVGNSFTILKRWINVCSATTLCFIVLVFESGGSRIIVS